MLVGQYLVYTMHYPVTKGVSNGFTIQQCVNVWIRRQIELGVQTRLANIEPNDLIIIGR
jgi:hypothetical protein